MNEHRLKFLGRRVLMNKHEPFQSPLTVRRYRSPWFLPSLWNQGAFFVRDIFFAADLPDQGPPDPVFRARSVPWPGDHKEPDATYTLGLRFRTGSSDLSVERLLGSLSIFRGAERAAPTICVMRD